MTLEVRKAEVVPSWRQEDGKAGEMVSVLTPRAGQPAGGAVCLSAALGIREHSSFLSVVGTNVLTKSSLGVIRLTLPGEGSSQQGSQSGKSL